MTWPAKKGTSAYKFSPNLYCSMDSRYVIEIDMLYRKQIKLTECVCHIRTVTKNSTIF